MVRVRPICRANDGMADASRVPYGFVAVRKREKWHDRAHPHRVEVFHLRVTGGAALRATLRQGDSGGGDVVGQQDRQRDLRPVDGVLSAECPHTWFLACRKEGETENRECCC